MSVLSLGLLLPFGAGVFPDRAITILKDAAAQTPAKHVSFLYGSERSDVQSHAATIDAFLAERGIIRQPDDRVVTTTGTSLVDGTLVEYHPAVNLRLTVDGTDRTVRTPATTVGAFLADQHVQLRPHDRVEPGPQTPIRAESTISVTHVTSWLERVRIQIAPAVKRKYDIAMPAGTQRVVDPGTAGVKETTVAVMAPLAAQPSRTVVAARVLRFPRAKIVAEGVDAGVSFSQIAHRGFIGTLRLADAALKMVATAYTAQCSGCSGITALGRPAGHGVVAVDPRVIPLGSHLFIPGYGHALAGDTGGAIRGNRIDLGFDSHRDAMTFGRRPIVVYLLK